MHPQISRRSAPHLRPGLRVFAVSLALAAPTVGQAQAPPVPPVSAQQAAGEGQAGPIQKDMDVSRLSADAEFIKGFRNEACASIIAQHAGPGKISTMASC